MKKLFLLMILLGLIICESFAQQEIRGKSKPKAFKIIKEEVSPEFPPILTANIELIEPNGDKIIEGGETAILKLTLSNKGKGEAHLLKLRIADEISDPSFSFEREKNIDRLLPEQSLDINIPITTDIKLKSNKHILHIVIDEGNGYNLDPPIQLILYTMEYQKPQFSYKGYEVCDTCEGTSAIIADNIIQPGEMVKVKMFIQNIGLNTARDVNYTVLSKDKNVNITKNSGKLGDLAAGENKSFGMFISPNKKFKSSEIPLFLTLSLSNDVGNMDSLPVPIAVNQKPAESLIVEVKPETKGIESLNVQTRNFESDKINMNIEEAPDSKTNHSKAVAVVIGIENYSDLPKAPYSENDAKIITNYLKNTLGIPNVLSFTNEKANYIFFDNMFNLENGELKKMVSEGIVDIFIFFSGHGLPSLVGEQIYLIPSDCKKDRLSSQGINLTAFYNNLQHIGAQNVIVFLDACFSGVSRQSETIKPVNLLGVNDGKSGSMLKSPWINSPAFMIYNASSSEDGFFADDQSKTGLFTYYLCLGLKGEADSNNDKVITTGELAQYIQKKVMQTSDKLGGHQIPQFHGNSNYVLVKY